MKGIELAELYYNEFGKPMLQNEFADILKYLAVGLVGSGSECYGFDDNTSRDHDFEAGFCIFIPDETVISRKTEFMLERAYAKLPKEFMGVKKGFLSPVGGNRHGVIRIADFYKDKIGNANGLLTENDWFNIPDSYLAEATNGKIFFDNYRLFSKIRNSLLDMPNDIRLKKIAGNILLMGQSGQYNYNRCLLHNEQLASQLALVEFVKSTLKVIFYINKRYMPYYKWSFKAYRNLTVLSNYSNDFEILLTSPNTKENSLIKQNIIEKISNEIIVYLFDNDYCSVKSANLEDIAYMINDKIQNSNIRNRHILDATE